MTEKPKQKSLFDLGAWAIQCSRLCNGTWDMWRDSIASRPGGYPTEEAASAILQSNQIEGMCIDTVDIRYRVGFRFGDGRGVRFQYTGQAE